MWIKNKRGLLVNTQHVWTIDIVSTKDEDVWEVQAQKVDERQDGVALYWGTVSECALYAERLETIMSVRTVELTESMKNLLTKLEPQL